MMISIKMKKNDDTQEFRTYRNWYSQKYEARASTKTIQILHPSRKGASTTIDITRFVSHAKTDNTVRLKNESEVLNKCDLKS